LNAFQSKVHLLRGLIDGDTARGGPIYVSVDVTGRCNLRCAGCRSHSPHASLPLTGGAARDLDPDLFTGLCRDLSTMGTGSLLLIGEGEPLVHPSIVDMIGTAKRAGFYTTLYTNGTLLDSRRSAALIDSGLDNLQVSLWASSCEEYAASYPGTPPAMFDTVVEHLRQMAAMKADARRRAPKLVLNATITRINARSVADLARLAETTGCDGLSLWPLRPRGERLDALALTPDDQAGMLASLDAVRGRLDARSLEHNLGQFERSWRVGADVWREAPCYIGWVHSKVRSDGTVVPCSDCDLPMGTLRETSFAEIWNGASYRQFRRRTRTREGLASMAGPCHCEFCCHLENNTRVHRVARWLPPRPTSRHPS
jgi:MoaA/NifB/PqqE/SkfB family radical SAM enzyme